MRACEKDGGLTVGAVAGSYVVQLGMDLPRADASGLLGFSIHRTDHTAGTSGYLKGHKAFRSVTGGTFYPPYSSEQHPLQDFQWSDYVAEPGHQYTYVITALKGDALNPQSHASVDLDVHTEHPKDGIHDVF